MNEPKKMGVEEVMRLVYECEIDYEKQQHAVAGNMKLALAEVQASRNVLREALTAIIEQRDQAQRRLVDVLLKQAVNETAEVRKRLLESENIPAELWEMRFK